MAEKVVIGNAELWHGDCREVLPSLPKHDLVLTDPPYGIDVGAMNMGAGKKATGFEPFAWDAEPPPPWLFGLLREKGKDLIVWGGNYFSLEPNGCWLSWDKIQEFSGADFELAYTTLRGPSKTFRMARAQAYGAVERAHPTQKPLALMAWCIGKAPDAQTVLDPRLPAAGQQALPAPSLASRSPASNESASISTLRASASPEPKRKASCFHLNRWPRLNNRRWNCDA